MYFDDKDVGAVGGVEERKPLQIYYRFHAVRKELAHEMCWNTFKAIAFP